MTTAQVETQVEKMFSSMCGFYEKDPFTVSEVLTAALDESVITQCTPCCLHCGISISSFEWCRCGKVKQGLAV
jgi:hypothetical protein